MFFLYQTKGTGMKRWLLLTLFLLAGTAAAEMRESSAGRVKVDAIVEDLDTPWAFGFLPGGELLITERDSGILWRIGPDGTRRSVSGVPEVRASGQGGLLDVVPDPAFAETGWIYLSYSEPEGFRSARTAVARAQLVADRLEDLEVIYRQQPETTGGRHFGSRIVPDGAGRLWVTLGDRGEDDLAQSTEHDMGKVIRINADGSPLDNGAFPQSEHWSIGHRNAQGAATDADGRLWTVSHGARGGDEINRPELGRNYGWPVISYGTQYSGFSIGEGTAKSGMEQPVWYWDPSIAPSGMMIYSGKLWPDWAGDIFVGSLKFDFLSRLDREGDRVTGEERLFEDHYYRIRDVREGPDGAIWFLAENDGTLYRVTPGE